MDDSAGSSILSRALSLVGAGCWVYHTTTGRLDTDESGFRWLGYLGEHRPSTSEELVELIHPLDRQDVVLWFRNAASGEGSATQCDYRLKTPTGGWRWVQSKVEVLQTDPSGLPVELLIVSRDLTQVKVLQQALAEAEARWTSLVDEAPIGISLVGEDGQLRFLNNLEASRQAEPAIGHNWKEFLPSELHAALDSALFQTLDRGQPTALETYRNESDGAQLYFENHLSPVKGEGSGKSAPVPSLDVTQEHLARRRQRKTTRRMEILLSLHGTTYQGRQISYRIAVVAAKELTDAADAFLFMLNDSSGVPVLVASTNPPRDQAIDGLLDCAWEAWNAGGSAFRNQVPFSLSVPMLDAGSSGMVLVVQNSRRHFVDDDAHELSSFANSFWLLLERKDVDAKVEQLHQAIEKTPISILITGLEGEIEYANQRFLDLSGFSAENVLGRKLWELHAGQNNEAVLDELWSAIRRRKGWQGELLYQGGDGRLMTELVTVSPLEQTSRQTSGFVVVKEDITERKQSQEMIYQAQKMETLGQVAAGVAHDFNNLLTGILGFNEMILRRFDQGENVKAYAEKIRSAGERAASLVSGLLAAGRRQRLSPEKLDLVEFLSGEVPLLAGLAPEAFHFGVGPDRPSLLVEIDRGQMAQVVMNLVSNARDAIQGHGSSITLSVGSSSLPDGNFAWFRVTDDGPGIPEDIQAKIFEPFFTTKSLGKGTGLGLAMVQGIVLQHQGKLTLETSPGQGASFTVYLPNG
jgi:PAS domain S-box-containing protein